MSNIARPVITPGNVWNAVFRRLDSDATEADFAAGTTATLTLRARHGGAAVLALSTEDENGTSGVPSIVVTGPYIAIQVASSVTAELPERVLSGELSYTYEGQTRRLAVVVANVSASAEPGAEAWDVTENPFTVSLMSAAGFSASVVYHAGLAAAERAATEEAIRLTDPADPQTLAGGQAHLADLQGIGSAYAAALEDIEEARLAAIASLSAPTAAAITSINDAAGAGVITVNAARDAALTALTNQQGTSVTAVQAAGTSATTAVTTVRDAAILSVNAARDAALLAITTQQTTSVAAVAATGETYNAAQLALLTTTRLEAAAAALGATSGRPARGQVVSVTMKRTNLAIDTEVLQGSSWTATTLTRTGLQTDPNATLGACLCAPSGASASLTQTIPTEVGKTYTFSVYIKASSGTPSISIALGSATATCALTTSYQRFSVSFTAIATSTVASIGTGSTWSTTEDATVAFPQVEAAAAATTYVKTNSGQHYAARDRNPQRLLTRGSAGSAQVVRGALVLPGVTGNRVSTPDSAAVSITGDIDVRVYAALRDWTPSSLQTLIGRDDVASSRVWHLFIDTLGRPAIEWFPGGTGATARSATSTVALPVSDGQAMWVRFTLDVDNGAAGSTTTFYYGTDGLTWTPLGAAVVGAGVTSLFDGTNALEVGSRNGGVNSNVDGLIYRAEVYNGIGGTLAAVYDARALADGTTSHAASTGEVWTLTQGTGVDSSDGTQTAAGLTLASTSYAKYDNALGYLTPDALTETTDPLLYPRRLATSGTAPTLGSGAIGTGTFAYGSFGGAGFLTRTDADFGLGQEDGAWSCWFYVNAIGAAQSFVSHTGDWGYRITSGGAVTAWIKDSTGTERTHNAGTVAAAGWHFGANRYTYSTHTLAASIAGAAATSTSLAGTKGASAAGTFQVGYNSASGYLTGRLHQVAFWKGASTPSLATLITLYNSGTPLPYASWSSSLMAGLVACYEFAEVPAQYAFITSTASNAATRGLLGSGATGIRWQRVTGTQTLRVSVYDGTTLNNYDFAGAYGGTGAEIVCFTVSLIPGYVLLDRNGVAFGQVVRTAPARCSVGTFYLGFDGTNYNDTGALYAFDAYRATVALSQAERANLYIADRAEVTDATVLASLPALS